MKKRALSLLLATVMITGTLAGCGSGSSESSSGTDAAQNTEDAAPAQTEAETETEEDSAPAEETGGTETASGEERTKITVMLESSESGEPYQIWSQLYEGYIAENNLDVEVEWELIPNDDDYANKLQLYFSSNTLPDHYGCANGTFSSAAKDLGAIVNIGDELKRNGHYDDMNGAIVDFLTDADDGNLYLFPAALYSEFFYYRKDKFDQYGLEAPATWDEFLNVCSVLKENGETPVMIGGQSQWQIMRYISLAPWRVTGASFIMDFVNLNAKFADYPESYKGAEIVYEMGDKGYFQDGFTATPYSDAQDMFFGGEGCIFYGGSGQCAVAADGYDDGTYGVFPVPSVDGYENNSTDVPIHAGFANAFNAQTYDGVMQGFFDYVCEHFGEACYSVGLFSPFNSDEIPEEFSDVYEKAYELFNSAEIGWASWDDKLDAATCTAMQDLDEELALGMITPEEWYTELDKIVVENNQ